MSALLTGKSPPAIPLQLTSIWEKLVAEAIPYCQVELRRPTLRLGALRCVSKSESLSNQKKHKKMSPIYCKVSQCHIHRSSVSMEPESPGGRQKIFQTIQCHRCAEREDGCGHTWIDKAAVTQSEILVVYRFVHTQNTLMCRVQSVADICDFANVLHTKNLIILASPFEHE